MPSLGTSQSSVSQTETWTFPKGFRSKRGLEAATHQLFLVINKSKQSFKIQVWKLYKGDYNVYVDC
jgi:hypothetical protein